MSNDIRVRYGRLNNQTKNTLVTIRDGETIYFGIARCRLNADKMIKEKGKELASARAEAARNGHADFITRENTLALHKSNLFGRVEATDVVKLLAYFDNIEDIMLPDYLKK